MTQSRRPAQAALGPVLFALVCSGLAGCAADRPLRVRMGDAVRRPARAAVVFFIDGFGQKQFDDALAEGRIPNIERHLLRRGTRVEAAVSCLPSITYANAVSFLTGRLPGHHGIVSNKWYEPATGRYQNYAYIKTYQQVDGDYEAPTIYELLPGRVTVSIQAAQRRGVTRTIDNWATSGINWFFDNTMGVDSLVAQRFELIAESTSEWGRWPDLILAYFPGPDRLGHRFGPDARPYKQAIANVDRQIGRICDALRDIGMYENTYLCLVSDHGLVPVRADQVFDIAAFVQQRTGRKVWSTRCHGAGDRAALLRDYGFAMAISGSRWAALYPLADGPGTDEMARLSQALRDHAAGASSGFDFCLSPFAFRLPPWLAEVVAHRAVELAAVCFRPGEVHLFQGDRRALILRDDGPPQTHRLVQQPGREIIGLESTIANRQGDCTGPTRPGSDPQSPISNLQSPIESRSDGRAWLRATAKTRYPDLVPQIVAMFDSPRAGTVVFFAADGWDFSRDDAGGGHGSILPAEMRVPMVFAGPGVPVGAAIPVARNCDLMPTLLHFLGAEPRREDGTDIDIDGINLLPWPARGNPE